MQKCVMPIFLFALLVANSAGAEPVFEVVTVNNRLASEIEPLLAPLLENTDQVVANGSTLIVKTSPERLQTIINVIQKLDKPSNSLLITVMQSRDVSAEQLNAGIDFGASYSKPGVRTTRDSRQYPSLMQNNNIISTIKENQNIQTIRTMDGKAAFIKTGKDSPRTNFQIYNNGFGNSGFSQSTEYVDASTGVAVTPKLVGDQVVLDVSPWSNSMNKRGQLQTQEVETTIRANLGEWVDLGGIDESTRFYGNSLSSINHQSRQTNLRILVKVDLVQ